MSKITLTLDTDQLSAGGEDIKQLAEDIQAFINILHHASPDYIEAGNILQAQLDEQMKKLSTPTDPHEKFCEKLDEICPYKIELMLDADIKYLYAKLKSEIGEAMGPVSYAAYKLAQALRGHELSFEWVGDFVKYYEDNWETMEDKEIINWCDEKYEDNPPDWSDIINEIKSRCKSEDAE